MKKIRYAAAALAAVMMMSGAAYAIDLPFVPISDITGGGGSSSGGDNTGGSTSGDTQDDDEEDTPVVKPVPDPVIPDIPSSAPVSSSSSAGTEGTLISPVVTASDTDSAFSATARSEGSTLILEWSGKKGTEYSVYLLKDGKYKKVAVTTDTSCTFEDAKNNTVYKFLVKSGSTSAKVTAKAYYKPAVTVTEKDGKVTLKWKAVPDATKYAVYRYNGGKLKKVGTTTKTSIRLSKKDGDTGYAVKAYVNGKWTTLKKSDIVSAQ
jgi:hypothetical protein